MNTKKFVLAFILVFVLVEVTNYIIHTGILASAYMSEEAKAVFRPEAEMMDNMWMMWLVDIVWSFFFVFFFVKGYENKGWMEGLRFGIYMGLFWNLVGAYGAYTVYPLPYSIVFQWFIYGLIQSVILGISAALVYKPKTAESPQPAIV